MCQNRLSYSDYIFSTGTIIQNTIYFFSEKENTLMKVNMNDWKIEYDNRFIDRNLDIYGKTDLLRTEGCILYRLPLKGGRIDIFSLEDGIYKNIEIKKYDKDWDNFIAFESRGKFLYVFPKWEEQVFKIDLLNYKVYILPLMPEYDGQERDKRFTNFLSSYREDNLLWLFEEKKQRVCIYNMNTDTYLHQKIPLEISECISFCKTGKLMYCLTSDSKIYVWDMNINKCDLLWNGESYKNKKRYFGQIVAVLEKLIVLPCFGDELIIVDCKSGTVSRYNNYPKDFVYSDTQWSKYINGFSSNKSYYYPMRLSNYLMEIDRTTGEIIWNKMIMPVQSEKIDYLQKKFKKQPCILYENEEKINIFFDILKTKKSREKADLSSVLGNTIWEKTKIV